MDENFIIDLFESAESYEQWKSIMAFGMGTLIENQDLLIEVIVRQAAIMAKDIPNHQASDQVAGILADLKLRLVVMEAKCPKS